MADHNFLTDTYDTNTAILDECKGYIAEVVLPSEPTSQFDDIEMLERMTIDAINGVLGTVSQLFEGQAYTYRFAKKGVCLTDDNYYPKLIDSVEDIVRLTLTINSMTNLMNVTCTSNSFIGSLGYDVASLLSSGIASIELSEYMTQDESGEYIYDDKAIAAFFNSIKYNDSVSQKDRYIVESLLYSCINGDYIDTEHLELILNSSKCTVNENDRKLYPSFWEQVSAEMNRHTETLILQDYSILTSQTNGERLSEEEIKLREKLVQIIQLNDIVKVMNARSVQIQNAEINSIAVFQEQYSKSGFYQLSDYYNQYGLLGFFSEKNLNDYSQAKRDQLVNASKATIISINYVKSDDSSANVLPYLNFNLGGSTIAIVEEFTSATNTSILEARNQATVANATEFLESLLHDDVVGVSENDYVSKNYTFDDEYDETMGIIKSIPVIGEVASLTETMVKAEFAAVDYMTRSEMTDEQNKDSAYSLLDATGEAAGKIPYVGKAIKSGTKIIKIENDDSEKKANLRKEYQRKIAENQEIYDKIADLESGSDSLKNLLVYNGATNKETAGKANYAFSFIYYQDTKEIDTSIMLENP